MREVWIWQNIISPHIAGLAVALARQGCAVTYVAEMTMSADRVRQGWSAPDLSGVNLRIADQESAVAELVHEASATSIHICQGIRDNGLVGFAQAQLTERGLRQWVVMETVWDSGAIGVLKRLEYRRLFARDYASLQGVLATGHRTAEWVVARGLPAEKVFPFAYFLPDEQTEAGNSSETSGPYRFVFAGQLIPRKRLDWLIDALADVEDCTFELWVVGKGEDESALGNLATRKLGDRVRWLGQFPIADVSKVMAQADCLVLPSVHDGWGAVASEAMMQGTPVVCSDACGVAGAVLASGVGGVFKVNDRLGLRNQLARHVAQGKVTAEGRARLATWAKCLGASAGAGYLLDILDYTDIHRVERPVPPWLERMVPCADLQSHCGQL